MNWKNKAQNRILCFEINCNFKMVAILGIACLILNFE
jgi:hypothetical protein